MQKEEQKEEKMEENRTSSNIEEDVLAFIILPRKQSSKLVSCW